MDLVDKQLTFSLVFNIGIGVVKSNVSIKNKCKFKSKIFMLPFLAITYTECYVGNL